MEFPHVLNLGVNQINGSANHVVGRLLLANRERNEVLEYVEQTDPGVKKHEFVASLVWVEMVELDIHFLVEEIEWKLLKILL